MTSHCETRSGLRSPQDRSSGPRPRAGGEGVETWPALCLHSTPIPAFPLPGGRSNFLAPQPRRRATPIVSSRTPRPARGLGCSRGDIQMHTKFIPLSQWCWAVHHRPVRHTSPVAERGQLPRCQQGGGRLPPEGRRIEGRMCRARPAGADRRMCPPDGVEQCCRPGGAGRARLLPRRCRDRPGGAWRCSDALTPASAAARSAPIPRPPATPTATRTRRRVLCASEAAQRSRLTMSRHRPERRYRCA